ncbi:MAG: hypothetical protein ACM3L6_00520 [Deltaproteobacteria bacterium]
MRESTQKTGVVAIWRAAINLVISEPRVLIPFAVLAGIEVAQLFFLANSPHFPVNVVMAQPIRRIWGEAFLHYPYIYELLPRMFYYAKMAAGILAGGVTTGMACLAVLSVAKQKRVDLKDVFGKAMGRYVSLFLLMLLLYGGVHFVMKQPQVVLALAFHGKSRLLFLGPKPWFNVILPVCLFLLAVILQSFFVYAVPYVVIGGRKFLPALGQGVVLFFRNFWRTLILVGVPMVLYIPVTIMRSGMHVLADKFGPESIIPVLLTGVLVAALVVDVIVTVATTLYFIEATDA